MTYFIRSSPWAQKCWLDDSPFENVHTVNIDFLSLSIVHAGVYSTVYGEYILLVLSKLKVRRMKSRMKIDDKGYMGTRLQSYYPLDDLICVS